MGLWGQAYPTKFGGTFTLFFAVQPANVILLSNTDGVSVFQSSKATFWPVWLIVNELPRRLRYDYKTRILNII